MRLPSLHERLGVKERWLRALVHILRVAEADGQRCAGPIALTGLILGSGVVALVSGPLGQTSRFSLELLMLLLFQLLGPLLVSVIALALLLPFWLERQGRWLNLPALILLAPALMLLLVVSAVLGGVLLSPRADLMGEITDLLSDIRYLDLARPMLRAAVFLMGACWYCLWRTTQLWFAALDPSAQMRWSSDLLLEGLALLLAFKLAWILLIEPIRLSPS